MFDSKKWLSAAIFIFASHWPAIAFGDEPVRVVLTFELNPRSHIGGRDVDMDQLVRNVNRRLGDIGKAKSLENGRVVVELYGDLNDAKLKAIEYEKFGVGTDLGFRILADPRWPEDQAIVVLAKRAPSTQKKVSQSEIAVAEWVAYAPKEFGPVVQEDNTMVKRLAGGVPEALVLVDRYNVRGEDLVSASKVHDEHGQAVIHFRLNKDGAKRFEKLTSEHVPKPGEPERSRRLGVIFNHRLVSAPKVRSTISDLGMISGGSMTEDELNILVEHLNAGSLPKALQLVDEKWLTSRP